MAELMGSHSAEWLAVPKAVLTVDEKVAAMGHKWVVLLVEMKGCSMGILTADTMVAQWAAATE